MTVAAVALLVLTVAARAANADARTSIVSGFDDLEDLAPPGSTTCLKWHDVLEETNEALRRCELSSSRDFDEAASTTTAALPPPVPFRAEPTLVDLNDNRATSLQDGTGQPLRQTAATSTGDADAMEPSSRDLLHTSTYDDLLNDPKTRDIIDGYDGASRPHWVVHPESHEERTAHLLRHVDKKGRRLQDDGNLAAALLDGDDGTIGCTDPLASNDGALGTSCTYSCAALEQEYFPGQPARCFLYDPSTQTWPAELLAMRQQRLEVHTYIDQVAGANPAADTALAFTVGSGRSCQNVTITSSMMAPQTTRTEVVCLVDGEHEYNHTITDEHSVEVVGYADSGVHTGAGGTTSFVVGECTDVLIRVTTIAAGSAGGSPITWSIDDGGHNGPWTFDSAGGAGVHEYASCMFDNDFTLTREPSASSWQGSVEVVGFIQYHNTITIPNNENWIVQGNVDPATGLPVSLDARLSSGTPLDRSHANIALRYVRFTGHFAPAEVSPQLVGYGGWWTPGTYGGAFRYEGGSSDPANLVRLTFDHVIYDHNGATVGGAMLINGRAGAAIDGASTQNWESGIAATWVSCMFYRNFAEFSVPGVMVSNVWPMAISWNNSAFIENSCDLVGSVVCVDNWYIWDALTVQGPDRRVGSATLVQMDTLVDGGWSTEGLVTSVMSSGMMFQVDGSSPSEPDAVWNVTISGATYRNVKTLLHPVPLWFGVFPPNARNQFEMNVLVSDVTVTDCTATVPHIYDALYFVADYCNFLVERTRFERNGYFNDDAMGFGGCHSLAVPNLPAGEARPRLVYVNTEWIGNAAGYGAALYIVDEFVFVVDQCLFRENIARKGGAAIYFKGALNTELIVSRSVFEMNAVRPPQSGEKNAPATVVAFTDTLAEGEQRAFVWRIDDGPVRGIGWDYCQDVMERSQWSVQHGYPPSWPSTLPSSCSNETYSVFTTYSTTEMLTPGDHTLWHGTVTTSAMSVELSHSSWIK
jgi:predicted outer membrane repeat protein|eukprot:COSAG06_NODE_888_length_11767_cov_5.742372_2_plen_981_part_00